MDEGLWTLDQLTERVADALAVGYSGPPSARIRDVPNQRVIRWYVTRGLVDPPIAMRGRQALYGRRHLLQLVAVKRLQARGLPLATIQAELGGQPDRALAEVAQVGAAIPIAAAADASVDGRAAALAEPAAESRIRFWAAAPEPARAARTPAVAPPVRTLRLAPGVLLVLDPEAAGGLPDLPDHILLAAARPLRDLLARQLDEGTIDEGNQP